MPKQDFDEAERNARGGGFWNVIGRLRPDVSVEQAQAGLGGDPVSPDYIVRIDR